MKRLRLSLESYVENEVIELQEAEPRVKYAPKRTADDDFLDALNHVSFHMVVEGSGDQLVPKERSCGPVFQPDLTESLRELDELLHLLHGLTSAPLTTEGQPAPKCLELHNVHREEKVGTEAAQVILHSRQQTLRDAAAALRRSATELRGTATKQERYTQQILRLQHEERLLQLPAPQGIVDVERPHKALVRSDMQQRLWRFLLLSVQSLPPSSGMCLTAMTDDCLRVELTATSDLTCRLVRGAEQGWPVASITFETNVKSMKGEFIGALFREALLRSDTAVEEREARSALTLRPRPPLRQQYNAELQQVFLHVQHAAHLHDVYAGLSELRKHPVARDISLCPCRPLQWPNCSAFRLFLGQDTAHSVTILGTTGHVHTDAAPCTLHGAVDLLAWITAQRCPA